MLHNKQGSNGTIIFFLLLYHCYICVGAQELNAIVTDVFESFYEVLLAPGLYTIELIVVLSPICRHVFLLAVEKV